MKKTVFLLLLLTGLLVPWATHAQTPVLFSEGFENTIDDNNDNNYGIPAGWSRDGTYGNSWAAMEGSQWAHSGDYYMQSGNGSLNSGKKLMSPNIAGYLSSVNSAELRFAFYQPLSSSNYGPAHMRVFYRTAETDPWLQIWEYSEVVTDWQLARGIILPEVQNITSHDDFYQIAFDMQTGHSGCCVFLDDVQIVPADKIVIGSGPFDQSDKVPVGIGYYVYQSLSEQIYTSDELGDAGTILSIDFYGVNNYTYDNEPYDVTRGDYGGIDVYMVHTNSTAFQTDVNGYIETGSWIGVAETNRVYHGRVVFPFGESWTTITLDTPFNYNGTDNVLLVIDDNSDYRSQNVTFRTFSTSDVQSIYNTSGNDYYYFNPTTGRYGNGGGACRCKNQICILKVTCIPPAGLTARNVTDETATLSWTERGDATDWVVEYADNIDFTGATSLSVSGTPSASLIGLDGETPYYARVKAVCTSDDESPWTDPISFTTDFCPPTDKCEILYELHAAPGEDVASVAWDGAAIRVIDCTDPDNEILLAKLTIEEDYSNYEDYEYDESDDSETPLYTDYEEETDHYSYARGTLPLCIGRNIRFEWESSSWGHDDLYSFEVYDADYNTLFSGIGEYNPYSYTTLHDEYEVNCIPTLCPRPTNVTVNYEGGTTATVTWDNVGSDYDVGLINHENGEFINIFSTTTNSYTLTGLDLATTYDVQVVTVCDRDNYARSHASRTATFTTDMCMPEDMCTISYELHDQFGDGWDGNAAIVVADVTNWPNEIILATWTLDSPDGGEVVDQKSGDEDETEVPGAYKRGTLNVCDGSVLQFFWRSGSCDGECTFTIYDASGAAIVSGRGSDYNMWGYGGGDYKSLADDYSFIDSCDINCSATGISANSWYAISTYLQGGYSLGNENNMLTFGDYDLYRYKEADATWENYKSHSTTDFTSLETGRGYIYRRSSYFPLAFEGTENAGTLTYSLSYTNSCPDADLKGFNLIGNPYPHSIVKSTDCSATGLATGYYSLEGNGSWLAHTDSDPINKGQAVLVKVSAGTTLMFTDNAATPADPEVKGSGEKGLQFILMGDEYKDVAYALFTDKDGLPKVGHLNAEAPSLSIAQGGTDYAIATIGEGTEAFPLKFRGESGEYTMEVRSEMGNVGFDYLHLIDRLTGSDIDLLRQPTYTFAHTGNQALANRFMVKLSPEGESTGDIFAYQNGDRIVVEGTGTLQVYDVLGRQLFTHEINSQFSMLNSQFPSTGVYILRLNGKSQKLVIK